jgi:DNA topoisomerase-1
MAVIEDRGYVRIEKKRLVPEDKGRLVTAFLSSFFKRYVEYDFTAALEEQLDLISDGKLDWQEVLAEFWRNFTAAIDETKELRVADVLEALNEVLGPHIFPPKEDGSDPRACPACQTGRLSLKVSGKFGAFVGCENYPDCRFTRQLTQAADGPAEAQTADGKLLGEDPETGVPVTLRIGRFGPYVQLGEGGDGEKPPRASVPKDKSADDVDLAYALKLLALPREVGQHPETGKTITAGIGRYGPFVLHDGVYANLAGSDEVFEVGLNRAVSLIAEKVAGGGRRGFQRGQAQILKDLGPHPDGGGPVQVLNGRYGPYVKFGKMNATLPKSKTPEALTLEEAVGLIAERAEKAGTGKKPPAKKAPAKKAAAKKTAVKKSATGEKKTPAKKAVGKKTTKAKAATPSADAG